jgi:putative redox protein
VSDAAVTLGWTGTGLEFDGRTPAGHTVRVDGGRHTGASPMETMLLALGGCTAADVVEITTKMRVPIAGLEVRLEGDRAAEPPRRYTRIRLVYRARGVAVEDADKVRRAIALSEEKYCSVRHTLRADVELSSELELA